MSAIPDYRTYSLEQLHDVLRNINREVYPERYVLALQELREREEQAGTDEESIFNEETPDAIAEQLRRSRPALVGIAVLLGLTAIYGMAIAAIMALRGGAFLPNALAAAVGGIGLIAAILILQGSGRGVLLGIVAALGETIRFASPALTYGFYTPLDLFLNTTFSIGIGSVWLSFNPIGVVLLVVIIIALKREGGFTQRR